MFDTDNLHDEKILAIKRRRLYGSYTMMNITVDYAVFSPSKGALYFMCGAKKIFKMYPRLSEKPHTVFESCIVGVRGSEHMQKSMVRAIDVIEPICETRAGRRHFYSQLVVHTQKGQCFILCEDPPHLKSGHARLQLEETDKYPPSDALPLEDFQLSLPAQRIPDDK